VQLLLIKKRSSKHTTLTLAMDGSYRSRRSPLSTASTRASYRYLDSDVDDDDDCVMVNRSIEEPIPRRGLYPDLRQFDTGSTRPSVRKNDERKHHSVHNKSDTKQAGPDTSLSSAEVDEIKAELFSTARRAFVVVTSFVFISAFLVGSLHLHCDGESKVTPLTLADHSNTLCTIYSGLGQRIGLVGNGFAPSREKIDNIANTLKDKVFGQYNAITQLVGVVRKFLSGSGNLVIHVWGGPGTGKTHSTTILSKELSLNFPSVKVVHFVEDLPFVELKSDFEISEFLKSRISSIRRTVLIFESFEKMSDANKSGVRRFVSELNKDRCCSMPVLLIVVNNQNSSLLEEYYEETVKSGRNRMQVASGLRVAYKAENSVPYIINTNDSTDAAVIAFLPLDAIYVKMCIEQVLKDNAIRSTDKEIDDLLRLFENDSKLTRNGCKGLASRVLVRFERRDRYSSA